MCMEIATIKDDVMWNLRETVLRGLAVSQCNEAVIHRTVRIEGDMQPHQAVKAGSRFGQERGLHAALTDNRHRGLVGGSNPRSSGWQHNRNPSRSRQVLGTNYGPIAGRAGLA